MERTTDRGALPYTPHSDRDPAAAGSGGARVSPFRQLTGSRGQRCVQAAAELRRPTWMARVVLSPVMRLEDVPTWGKISALIAGALQYVLTDAFTKLLLLVVFAAAADYVAGVRVAKAQQRYDPQLAHAGALGKVMGLVLLLLVRLTEHWITVHAPDALHIPDTRGILATVVAMGLLTVDLQSIAKHRESLGLAPIPVLGRLFEWLHAFTKSKVPKPPTDDGGGA